SPSGSLNREPPQTPSRPRAPSFSSRAGAPDATGRDPSGRPDRQARDPPLARSGGGRGGQGIQPRSLPDPHLLPPQSSHEGSDYERSQPPLVCVGRPAGQLGEGSLEADR